MDQWIIFLLRLIKENDLIQLYLKFQKKYSQTCIKRSPFGYRKSNLKRGSIRMKFTMTGQKKGDLLI